MNKLYIIRVRRPEYPGEVWYHRSMNWMMVDGGDPFPVFTDDRSEAEQFKYKTAKQMVKCYKGYKGHSAELEEWW